MDCGEHHLTGAGSSWHMSVHQATVTVPEDLMTQMKKPAAFLSMMTHMQYVTTQEWVNKMEIHIIPVCHFKSFFLGLLCGQCKEGYGVGLLTNQCKRFTDIVPQFWLFPVYCESNNFDWSNWHDVLFFTVGVLIPLLVVIVKLGVYLPTILRGFIFYIQISPIAVEFLPQNFNLRVDVVSDLFLFFMSHFNISNTDVLYCQYPGSLCTIRLQLPWGNDFLGVLWTEICHSPRGTRCSANSSKSEVSNC